MIATRVVSALLMMSFCTMASSNPARSPVVANDQYCIKLAQIGASAFRTRSDGYPMERVLTEVNAILSSKPETREDANEVIVAIYTDKSVSSARQAYSRVYEDCLH
jgi:hypothetical protein